MRTKPRQLAPYIDSLALKRKKMAFISGPRQCGKTTLAKSFIQHPEEYRSWDQMAFKKSWQKSPQEIAETLLGDKHPTLVLDEFHKNPKWKNQLKGFYDTYGDKIRILVTGSSHLNTFRKGADSLLGRFLHFHLHPFSWGEISQAAPFSFKDFIAFIQRPTLNEAQKGASSESLFKFGGFPEPLFAQSEEVHRIWQKNRNELLIRQDLRDISQIINIGQVEILAGFLPDRVASPLSVQSLKEDLDVAHTTVTRWLHALASVYYLFEIKPFSKSIPRSLKKDGKIYLYDWSSVENEGARFENMIASHLLKMVDFYNDTGQAQLGLHYLRNKEKQEVDFLVTRNKKPLFTVEAKLSDLRLSRDYEAFQTHLKVPHFQIVNGRGLLREFKEKPHNAFVISFEDFFFHLP